MIRVMKKIILAIIFLTPAITINAQEWTQWRGPSRDGSVSGKNVPGKWPPQLVSMTEGSIVGIDARTGRERWSVAFPDEWHENITTPLWTGTNLVVSGTRAGTHAYSLAQASGKWELTEVWKNSDVAMCT